MTPRANSLPEMLRENASFFSLFVLFLLVGAGLLAGLQTGQEVFFFSERRSAGADLFFRYGTLLGEGYFFVVGLLGLLMLRYRYALGMPLLGIVVPVITQSGKAFFAQPRPAAYFRDLGILDRLEPVGGVVLHGGYNSFPSGHTMAAFALYAFLAFSLPRRHKRWGGVALFLLALIVGVSRIYLAQHFLKDVYLGAVLGVLSAAAVYYWLENLSADERPWLDRSLRASW